jgi:tagaturonate reductase
VTAFPILQFGTSRFLQAHVDLFVSQALARGEAMGRIAVVQTTSSKESRKRLDAFAAGKAYRVQVKGLAGGKIVDEDVEVTSVGAGFDASSQWDEVERLFNEAHCAVSNTADRGYEIDPADRPNAGPPRSFPAKLAKLMLARHRAGAKPITLFPCELTPANGKALRAVVLGVLDRWDGGGSGTSASGSIRSSTASSPSRSSRSAQSQSPTRYGRSRTSAALSSPAVTPRSR